MQLPGSRRPGRYRVPAVARPLGVALLFAVIVLAELWSPLVRGGVYTPADIGQASAITANPAQPRTTNRSQLDVYEEIDPALAFESRAVRGGHLPWWNPYDGNGEPFLGDAIPATFSPFTAPFYVLGFAPALVVSAGLKLWCIGFFTYLWLRRLLHRDLPAVPGGVLFAFAGYQIALLNWQVMVNSAAALPFGLWCTQVALDWLSADPAHEPACRRRVLRWCFVGQAVAVATAVVGGHPETTIFVGLVLAAYTLAGGIWALGLGARLWRWVARAAVAGVVGVALSAAMLAPFLQYESLSARTVAFTLDPVAGLPERHQSTVPMMAFPNLFGIPGQPAFDRTFSTEYGANYTELATTFTGLVTLCLVPLGLASLFRRRARFLAGFAASLALVGTAFFYTAWAPALWAQLPFLRRASTGRSEDVLLLGLAALAAVGVDWLLVGPETGRFQHQRWRVGALVVSAVGVSAIAVGGAWHLRHQIGVIAHAQGATEAVSSANVWGQIGIQLACVAGMVAAVAFLLLRRRSGLAGSTAAAGVLVAAACVSVMLPLNSWNRTVPRSVAYPETAALAQLSSLIGGSLAMYPTTAAAFPQPMTNLWFDLADIGSNDSLGVAWHDYLYAKAFGVPERERARPNTIAEQMPACVEDLRLFGVRYVIGGRGRFKDGGGLTPQSPVPNSFAVPNSGLVSVVGRGATVEGDGTAMDEVTNCGFDANTEVVLDPGTFDPNGVSGVGKMTGRVLHGSTAKVTARTATSLTVATNTSAPGWLVVRQTWYPGWHATVDGHAAPLDRADVAFDAIPVPAGAHRVSLSYASKTVSRGIDLSLAAAAVILVVMLWAIGGWRLRGRQRSES